MSKPATVFLATVVTMSSSLRLLLALFSLVLLLPTVALADDESVTCGSAVKLTHVESGNKFYLNSENQKLGSGSGQQLVTLVDKKDKTSSLWWVRESHTEQICETGMPIKCGQTLRLIHLDTMRNLHTHNIPSPLSRQQEITCFGNDGEGDTGDDWTVVCSTGTWKRGEPVRLLHKDTQKYLSASSQVQFNENNCGHQCPIMNHLEAFGRKGMDDYSLWKVELGVHLFK